MTVDNTLRHREHIEFVHQLFEEVAAHKPSAVAVISGKNILTYRELNEASNRLAHRLLEMGVEPDDRIAICIERSPEMIVGLLGILKSGAAYVPLDPSYPTDRLAFMLSDSVPKIVLTNGTGLHALTKAKQRSESSFTMLNLDEISEWSTAPTVNPSPKKIGLKQSHLVYVIYTSGSTGKPKGVMIEHRNLLNLLCSLADDLEVCDADVIAQITPLSFDISGLEIWLPLGWGFTLSIADHGVTRDPSKLAEFLTSAGASIVQATPAIWRLIVDKLPGNPKMKVICGGEAGDRSLWEKLTKKFGEAWNMYGPTETTIWSTGTLIQSGQEQVISIGWPIANTQVYIMTADMNVLPSGTEGEIFIGGAGVARGYINRPDLTSERFSRNPYVIGDRLYRTGDIGRYLPDGSIEFIGRRDFQIKIRGIRVEVGEVEAAVISHQSVDNALISIQEDTSGGKILVAYYVGRPVRPTDLRNYISLTLPDHMIPAAFVHMPAFELTPSGKISRQNLPPPQKSDYANAAYVPPRNLIEETLSAIWIEILNVDQVGRLDNFFDLGGHSILAVQAVLAIEDRLNIEIDLMTFLDAPDLERLALKIQDRAAHAGSSI